MKTELTVLLVDDEPSILDTLTTCIHWQQYGVGTILTATDGVCALNIMEKHCIDLLISDIKMPHMDGLSLLSEVHARYPETHLILLTAYGEFEYAKKAIQLGVENYLLKPLNIEELEETIDKTLNNIYNKARISQELFRDNILSRWLDGKISNAELSERASLIDVNLYLPEYCIVTVCKKQHNFSLSRYCKSCVKTLSSAYEAHYFRSKDGKYIFIIGGSSVAPQDLLTLFIEKQMAFSLDQLISISIGTSVSDIMDLPMSYRAACTTLDCSNLSTSNMFVSTEHAITDLEAGPLVQELREIFTLASEETRGQKINQLANNLTLNVGVEANRENYTLLSHSLLQLFSQEFPNHQDAQEHLKQRIHLFTPFSDKTRFVSAITELLEYAYLLYNYYFNQLSPIIQTAINYIHNHYQESVSIKEFCVKTKASTPYLGYLFRNETGLFFNNYLTQYRICVSIKLLLNTDKKINDIATAVGFSSPSYYISCFKKQTGLSPIKYRARQIEENLS